MHSKLLGRVFPFIPLMIGLIIIILQSVWGEPDSREPLAMMFVLIICSLVSWLFCALGLIIFKDWLFVYYKKLFQILSIVYLFPAIILALFVRWSLLYSVTIFLIGLVIIQKNKNC